MVLNNAPACPRCGTRDGVRAILYGLPAQMPDPDDYAIGGCCISADGSDPECRCLNCHTEWRTSHSHRPRDRG